jgi:putative aldouronate transport system substrate-binding protein
MKRKIFGIAVLLLTVALLEEVWAGGSGQRASSSPAAPSIDRSNFTPLGTYPIVKNKETITVMAWTDLAEWDFNTNWMTEFYENKTNVHVNWIPVNVQNFKERANLSLASGEQIDYISCGGHAASQYTMNEMTRLADQGLIVPIQDLLETDSVHFKANFSKVPGWKETITLPSGNIYGIPNYFSDYHGQYYGKMWVNKLFLKNLGLDYPKTWDEFHDMLVAFKTRDANGNGDPNDEIPLIGATDVSGARLSTYLMSAFIYDDGENRLYLDNGKVTASFTKPEFQQGLKALNQWFKEGLIAKESFAIKRPERAQINSNKYESIIGALPNSHNLNLGVRDSGQPVRWIDYEPIPPIKGPNGVQQTYYGYYFGISVGSGPGFLPETCKNPALVIRWLDWFGSEEGTLRLSFGASLSEPDPGRTGIDGKPARYKGFSNDVQPYKPGEKYYNNYRWGQQFPMFYNFDLYQGWQKAEDMLAPDGSGLERFLIVKSRENYAPYGVNPGVIIPPLAYEDADATEIALLTTNINTYVEECFAKFVVGDMDINTQWKSFQDELKRIGIEKYLDIIQRAYDKSAYAKK